MSGVIECLERSAETLVSRVPEHGCAELRLGAQLFVREGQSASFVVERRALDTFGPGRHVLSAENLPQLRAALALAADDGFRASLYFASLRSFVNQKWSTSEPIELSDSELERVELRAFGLYSFRVSNPGQFLHALVEELCELRSEQLVEFFRGLIVTRVAGFLRTHLHTVLDLPQHYPEISSGIQAEVQNGFDRYGVTLVDFKLLSLSPPEEVQELIDRRAAASRGGGASG
jgi:membrane protease subunit (stomatin/prohibitin family)